MDNSDGHCGAGIRTILFGIQRRLRQVFVVAGTERGTDVACLTAAVDTPSKHQGGQSGQSLNGDRQTKPEDPFPRVTASAGAADAHALSL